MAWPTVTIVNVGCLSMNRFWGEQERVRSATATCTLVAASEDAAIIDGFEDGGPGRLPPRA